MSRKPSTYDEERQAAADAAKLNKDFFMVFKRSGSPMLRALISASPSACALFLFLAEQADRTNAIVASGKALAAALEMSEATVSRAIKVLIEKNLVERLNSGGTNVFVLNPNIVWSAWKTGKTHCLFGNAKVLVSHDEQDATTRKRLNVLLSGGKIDNQTKSLFDDFKMVEGTPSEDDQEGHERSTEDVE